MPDAAPSVQRRPFQFRLWQLLWWTTLVALILGMHHLMGRAIERFGIGAVGISVFLIAETTVVISGTAIAVSRGQQRLRTRLLRGVTAGSCLAALGFGVPPLLMAIGLRDARPLIALAVIAALGAMLGLLIGLVVPLFRPFFAVRHFAPARQRFPPKFTDRVRHPALKRATDRVMRALVEAKKYAIEHRHASITPEHLLWALGTIDSGVTRLVMERLGTDMVQGTKRLAAWIASIPPDDGLYLALLSPESERLLDSALEEAQSMADEVFYVGTEHLVLGLLKHPEFYAARILHKQGVTWERFRAELNNLMKGKPPGVN